MNMIKQEILKRLVELKQEMTKAMQEEINILKEYIEKKDYERIFSTDAINHYLDIQSKHNLYKQYYDEQTNLLNAYESIEDIMKHLNQLGALNLMTTDRSDETLKAFFDNYTNEKIESLKQKREEEHNINVKNDYDRRIEKTKEINKESIKLGMREIDSLLSTLTPEQKKYIIEIVTSDIKEEQAKNSKDNIPNNEASEEEIKVPEKPESVETETTSKELEVGNVIFYTFKGEQGSMEQACIFYKDGTIKNVTLEEGREALSAIIKEETQNNNSKEIAKQKILKRYALVSGSQLEKNFETYKYKKEAEDESYKNNSDEKETNDGIYHMTSGEKTFIKEPSKKTSKEKPIENTGDGSYHSTSGEKTIVNDTSKKGDEDKAMQEKTKENNGDSSYHMTSGEKTFVKKPSKKPSEEKPIENTGDSSYHSTTGEKTVVNDTSKKATDKDNKEKPVENTGDSSYHSTTGEKTIVNDTSKKATDKDNKEKPVENTGDSSYHSTTGEKTVVDDTSKKGTPDQSEKNKGKKTTAENYAESKTSKHKKGKKSKKSKKKESFFKRLKKKFKKGWSKVIAVALAISLFVTGCVTGKNMKNKNKDDKNRSESQSSTANTRPVNDENIIYTTLLRQTKNETQFRTMQHQGNILDYFNIDFANNYLEEGKDIKAGLTWDEMMALNLAYNNYSKETIQIMFNGFELDANDLDNAFKNANLQLMGSYVISNRKNPVKISNIILDKDQKAFADKYEDLFYKCKETTGKEQVEAIDNFYKEINKDFPIDSNTREVGISHSDPRKGIEAYKASVIPMVGAMEMMFQNVSEIDHTLSDKAIAYFNDLGLCNLVKDKYEKIARITEDTPTNDKYRLYEEYRDTKIDEMTKHNNYPLSDEQRDLSQLDEFKKWVNLNRGGVIYHPGYTYTVTTEKETTDRKEAVDAAGEQAVEDAENRADAEVEEENKHRQEEAEREAAKKEEELQHQADKEAEDLQGQVDADDKDLQDNLDDANSGNGPITEEDIGHGAEFDDNHSDGNGNLNDSVENVTPNGDGAVDSNTPLPDPNGDTSETYSESSATVSSDNTSYDDIYEYEEPYEEAAYQYTKH